MCRVPEPSPCTKYVLRLIQLSDFSIFVNGNTRLPDFPHIHLVTKLA